jgi:glycine cleavage system pyridoxal-binding protein P
LDEHALFKRLSQLAAKNADSTRYLSFLSAGAYDHFIPSMVGAIISRGEFLTTYTPYQPEASQGLLQSIFEFQTMVCELTGMDVANASMYDASTALAESALMACNITGRSKVLVSQSVHPHYRQVMRTYLWTNSRQLVEIPTRDGVTDAEALAAALDNETACAIVQYPNFFGLIEPLAPVAESAHRVGALAIACVAPDCAGRAETAGRVWLRYRRRRGTGAGQRDGLRRTHAGAVRVQAGASTAHSRTHRRADDRRRGQARLCDDHAHPRTRHPPRESHLQHLHERGVVCLSQHGVYGVAGQARLPRTVGNLLVCVPETRTREEIETFAEALKAII